ncbi:MAG: hypothetical protein JKY54_01585, partial [Flavobacteriales bacterium]|nr:hypothetical protein [Flavobacteriales bacterium]
MLHRKRTTANVPDYKKPINPSPMGPMTEEEAIEYLNRFDNPEDESTFSLEISEIEEVEEEEFEYNEEADNFIELINDEEFIESIKDFPPELFVTSLGLDWEEVSARFLNKTVGILQSRTLRWIKECVLYGNETQRNIRDYTTSSATGALVRTELSEKDYPIIIAKRQPLCFIKAREINLPIGDWFTWETLGGKFQNIRHVYSDNSTWQNLLNLREGVIDKAELKQLLELLSYSAEEFAIVDSLSKTDTKPKFTQLIIKTQSIIGSKKMDGIADEKFIEELKLFLDINEDIDLDAIAVARIVQLYNSNGDLVNQIKLEATQEYTKLIETARTGYFAAGADGVVSQTEYARVNNQIIVENLNFFTKKDINKEKGTDKFTMYYDEETSALNYRIVEVKALIQYYLPEYKDLPSDNYGLSVLAGKVVGRLESIAIQKVIEENDEIREGSKISLSDRINSNNAYLDGLPIKQMGRLAGSLPDDTIVQSAFNIWGELHMMFKIERSKEVVDGFGFYLDAGRPESSEIQTKLNEFFSKLDIPMFDTIMFAPGGIEGLRAEIKTLSQAPVKGSWYNQLYQDKVDQLNFKEAIAREHLGSQWAYFLRYEKAFRDLMIERAPESTQDSLDQDERLKEFQLELEYLTDDEDLKPIENIFILNGSLAQQYAKSSVHGYLPSTNFSLPMFYESRGGEIILHIFLNDAFETFSGKTFKGIINNIETANLLPLGSFSCTFRGVEYDFHSNKDWHWSDVLAWIGLALAIVGAIIAAPFTAGTSLVATAFFVGAAAASIASSAFVMYEKSTVGRLNTGTIIFEVANIVANILPVVGQLAKFSRVAKLAKIVKGGPAINIGKTAQYLAGPSFAKLGASVGLFTVGMDAWVLADTVLS